jgi:hypothetical protein
MKKSFKKLSGLFILGAVFAFQATSLCAMESATEHELTVDEEMESSAIKRTLEADEEEADEEMDLCEDLGDFQVGDFRNEPVAKQKKLSILSLQDLDRYNEIQWLLGNSDKDFFLKWAPLCIDGCNKLLKSLDQKIELLVGPDKEEMLDVRNRLETELLMLRFKVLKVDDWVSQSETDDLIKQIGDMEIK